MVTVIFVFTDTERFASRQEMPECPRVDARVEIDNTDYICGHAYWYVESGHKQWVARIKLYLPGTIPPR